jgi:CBS domain-containing protein
MVSTVITVDPDAKVRDIADLLPDRISSVPVVGTDGILEL